MGGTFFKTSFLVGSFVVLMNFNVWPESIPFADSAARRSSLSRTVVDRSDRRYSTTPDLSLRGDSLYNSSLLSRNLDRGPVLWKYKISVTVFWIGEQASETNPVPNTVSAWDLDWVSHYGGEDDPINRTNFIPAGFIPRGNPFYVALPYNDVDDQHTRPEAALVIPWFKESFVRDGQSVCKGRWVAIRHGRRVCYAQWEDVGPFQSDHWQYVFGIERPRPNRNNDAGLDVSPAVRDYLGISGIDVCDWKFVNVYEVPDGPWALYGEDNTAASLRSRLRTTVVGKRPHKLIRTPPETLLDR
jgi:hypothetical protein